MLVVLPQVFKTSRQEYSFHINTHLELRVANHMPRIGSSAAVIQSSIRNVAAGSLFALGQSAGAGGMSLAAANIAAQAGGVLTGMGSAGFAWLKTNNCTE